MTNPIALTHDEMQTLAALANIIIPPSEAFGVPGAGDPEICLSIAAGARKTERLQQAIGELNALAETTRGAPFAELDSNKRAATAEQFQHDHAGSANMIEALTMQAYYRDRRVMASLGMEPRPPFPEGYRPPEGDWSLLEPVRRRAPLFRKAD